MNRRTRRLRMLLLVGAAALAVAVGLALQATHALRGPESATVDKRFDLRGKQPPPRDVVLVAIDEDTLTAPPRPTWPFNRHQHARVIRNLTKAGAKVIAYDVQFTQQSPDASADEALVEATHAAGRRRVVMATTQVRHDGSTDIFGGGAALRFSRAVPSFSAYSADHDGRIRHMKLGQEGLVGFDIAAAQLFTGHRIARPDASRTWIDYAGPPGSVRTLSFVDVRTGHFNPAVVRGKVVVVGATASVLQDRHPTSTTADVLMPGPEIHVDGIQTAIDGFPLHSVPGVINVLLVIALGVVAPLAALRLRLWLAVAAGLLAIAALLAGAQLVFNGSGAIFDVTYPLAAAIVGILATAAIHGVTVAFERAHTREAFARFVPETVVDEVLKSADGLRLGGVQREGTVMFSDLRGFTSFSETLSPAQVIGALNRYLTAMSEAILDHGGTLVAYMGDGIMAVFGAPLRQDDHADRALAASRDMLRRLEGFNQWLREEGLHQGFKMGIGLNSGPVMSGHVGSERRLEYTALGDTTNTAARLEGMTKGTPHQLFIADSTRAAMTRPPDDLIEVGEFEVRGRKAKVKLWSLPPEGEVAAEAPAPAAPPVEA